MRIRLEQRVSRLIVLAGLGAALAVAPSAVVQAQTSASAPGTVKGFVRVNGKTLTVSHASAVTAPDSFDPSVPVQLILLTPKPLAPGALEKAADRNAVFGLVPAGAIVEIGKNGHTVFLYHAALGGNRLQTGGGFPEFKTTNNRISGDVHTFMSGEQDEFGYKVRFELAFDAPIVKRLPIAKPATTAPAAPAATATTTKPPAGPLPKTRDEANKWLAAQGLGVGNEALVIYFVLGNKGLSADVVRAYITSGINVNHISGFSGDTPLNALTVACPGEAQAAEIAKLLIDAGADVNHQEKEGRKATPVMGAVFCPDLLPAILAKKPNLYAVDANGMTVMHYALRFGNPREKIARMIKDAGFDIAKYRKSLLEEADAAFLDSLSKPATTTATPRTAATPAPDAAPPAASAPPARAGAIDWKGLGPYPSRSRTEAARLLARPGTDTTADEHFWDAIGRREPQRLALALQAGANVKQLSSGSNYTPILSLVERCDLDREPVAQVSIAEQLIAAGADVNGLDFNKANALAVAADDCPIGVIHALIKAGVPLQAIYLKDQTALKAAITEGRADVVEALLDAGLDVKKEPYNVGRIASAMGNKAIEAALKKKRK